METEQQSDLNTMTMEDFFSALILAGMISSNKEIMFANDKLHYTLEAREWADHLIRAHGYGK